MFSEYSIVNGSVTLHVLENRPAVRSRLAVCVIPGLSEAADDWRELLEFLAPLQAAAVTLRGRGRSSSPEAGYTLEHHASDVAAFVDQTQAESVVLVAYSRSVGYALEYATSRPKNLAALVLLDYPSKHTGLSEAWAEAFAESTWRSRKASSVVALTTLRAIAREARPKDFAPYLSSVHVPTLIVRGGKAGAALSADGAADYTSRLPRCIASVLPQSTHALWEPNANDLYREIATFARNVAGVA